MHGKYDSLTPEQQRRLINFYELLTREVENGRDCPNCGVARTVENGIMEKCPCCDDDETDLSVTPDAP